MEQAVLVVEDDPRIGPQLVTRLNREGYAADLAADGERAVAMALAREYALIILDLNLPVQDGFAVMEALRHRSSSPILVLTGRQELSVRLRSFAGGAVDWMSKPFYPEELLARIGARLGHTAERPRRLLRMGELELDLDGRTLLVGEEPVHLTPLEFSILAYLIERSGRAVSRAQLAEAVLPPGGRSERTVDSHVAHLRARLGERASTVSTVWGVGYRFDPPRA